MSTAETEAPAPQPSLPDASRPVATADQLISRNRHRIVLSTGDVVIGRIPDSTDILLEGDLSERLMLAAVRQQLELQRMALQVDEARAEEKAVAQAEGDADRVAKLEQDMVETARAAAQLRQRLGYLLVIEPQMTDEIWGALYEEDKDMLVEIAERKRNTDADGNVLGVAVIEEYVPFRDEPASAPRRSKRAAEKRSVPRSRKGKV